MAHTGRLPILTPALEGSRTVVPWGYGGGGGGGGQRRHNGYLDPGPPGTSFRGQMPMQGGQMPMQGGYGVPTLMRQPQGQYMGPPTLIPIFGGYSVGPNYYPGNSKFKPHNGMYHRAVREPQSKPNPAQPIGGHMEKSKGLTLSTLQTSIKRTFANSADPDEPADQQPSQKELPTNKPGEPSRISRHPTQVSHLSHHQPTPNMTANKQSAPSRVSRHPTNIAMQSRMSRHPTMQSRHHGQGHHGQNLPPLHQQQQHQQQQHHHNDHHHQHDDHPRKSVKKRLKHPFPGPYALRKFRHLGYVAWFIEKLKANIKNLNTRPSSMFLFGIILKEIVAALHRIYLNPSGNVYPVLNDIIGPNCYDLSALVRGGSMSQKEESVLVQELQYIIENLIYHCTEIMPSTGVLGTHRKSAVFELIRSGKRFPDGYFWQCELLRDLTQLPLIASRSLGNPLEIPQGIPFSEDVGLRADNNEPYRTLNKDRIQCTDSGRTVNIGDSEGFLLLIGIFLSRSFITTLLMKPTDYGLSSEPLSDVAESNLRIVATALLYLVRRIAISRSHGPMPMPGEIARYLYQDDEMANVFSKLSRTFNYCEGLLREWGTEYIRRLRSSSGRSHGQGQGQSR